MGKANQISVHPISSLLITFGYPNFLMIEGKIKSYKGNETEMKRVQVEERKQVKNEGVKLLDGIFTQQSE